MDESYFITDIIVSIIISFILIRNNINKSFFNKNFADNLIEFKYLLYRFGVI